MLELFLNYLTEVAAVYADAQKREREAAEKSPAELQTVLAANTPIRLCAFIPPLAREAERAIFGKRSTS